MGLIVKNVDKSFSTKKVVDNINFEIQKPGVYGLLGTNGAGKTTTIRMILGILKKDSGEINWNGKEVQRKHVNFGYLPEERGVYPKTKIHDQLMYFAKLKGMKKEVAEERMRYWAKRLEVEQYLQMTPEKLSKGNQQKVQFITAILHDPELLVLDEPFSGLDPVNTELLKNVILELIKKGTYIIMSSHQMHSIEEFASDVLILNKGKTVLQGNLKEIKEQYAANRLSLSTTENVDNLIKQANLEIYNSKNNEYMINISGEEDGYRLFDILAQNHIKVEKFEIMKPSLHDIFIEKVGEE
ncbi:MAG: ATP-binding cassette domain-containing protein [Clostridia bacterium]|nr:ATP-binding cassette domain-containing protein [Clostridia bacterium]